MKDLRRFLLREINVAKAEFIIEREVSTTTGQEFIHLVSDEGEEVYTFWHNPNSKPGDKRKNTGGKKPYIMFMLQEMEKLQVQKIEGIEEIIGLLVMLSAHIEWSTGRLIHKRSKKPIRYSDLVIMVSFGKYKLNKILNELQSNNLLTNTAEGYFVSNKLIKKGGR